MIIWWWNSFLFIYILRNGAASLAFSPHPHLGWMPLL